MRGRYGTSPVRRRRTSDELETLDGALVAILRQQAPMTVRQVFYQAVVRGLVPKAEARGYRVVQRRLVALRRGSLLPYAAITDNSRPIYGDERWSDADAFLRDIAGLYRRDYWRGADVRVEFWIEKDALAGVLRPVTADFGLDLYVSRGFASLSYLARAAADAQRDGRPTCVYLLTDHDPSGLALAAAIGRDLRNLAEVEWHIERLAVTPEQIARWNLPTRPTKHTDPRASRFRGDSVELDAIPPGELRGLVREAIERHMEPQRLGALKVVEAEERQALEMLVLGS